MPATLYLDFPVSGRTSVRHPQLGRSAQNGAIRQKNDGTPDFDGAPGDDWILLASRRLKI
jgi:hypothetical protein